jgi:hypothetical protein
MIALQRLHKDKAWIDTLLGLLAGASLYLPTCWAGQALLLRMHALRVVDAFEETYSPVWVQYGLFWGTYLLLLGAFILLRRHARLGNFATVAAITYAIAGGLLALFFTAGLGLSD